MARKKSNVEVIGSTLDDEREEGLSGADTVTIAVALRQGHKFDDVPNGTGGTKTVTLPGIDDHLRGSRGGILSPDGNAVYVTLPRADWEAIKALHGRERMFLGFGNHAPNIIEIGRKSDIKAHADEIKSTATGTAPIHTKDAGVSITQKAV